jgi:type IV pilus assembly protein PilZ
MADLAEERRKTKRRMLSLSIKDKNALYNAYMDYVPSGGLFVSTHREFEMGDEISILLNLMGETERLPVSGKVVWITPDGAEGYRSAGIGFAFDDKDNGMAKNKIEAFLAGTSESGRSTHTM